MLADLPQDFALVFEVLPSLKKLPPCENPHEHRKRPQNNQAPQGVLVDEIVDVPCKNEHAQTFL